MAMTHKNNVHNDNCYCQDIIDNLMASEKKFYLSCGDSTVIPLLAFECDFDKLRRELIKWMLQVHIKFASSEETLEMSVRMFDSLYFRQTEVSVDNQKENHINNNNNNNNISMKCHCGHDHSGWMRVDELRLCALICYFLAFKYWERFPPKMADLLGLINDKYTPDEFMESEVKILNIVGCDFSIPLVSQYFGLYLAHESEAMRKKIWTTCSYLHNLTLTELRFRGRLGSTLAAVAYTLAKMLVYSLASTSDAQTLSHDQSLFVLEGFTSTMKDMWTVFQHSINNINSFKLQKSKFFSDKNKEWIAFINVDNLRTIQVHYRILLNQVDASLQPLKM